jgi:Flp pilus assembly protein CpaB
LAVFAAGAGIVSVVLRGHNADAGQARTHTNASPISIPPTNPKAGTKAAIDSKAVAIPDGMQGLEVSLTAPQAAAGYVQPGDAVNVYANVAKASDAKLAATSPCTALVAPNVTVVDVNPRPGAATNGQTQVAAGATVNYFLAVDPMVARAIIFFAANESLYLSLVPRGQNPTTNRTLPCASYAQEVPHP